MFHTRLPSKHTYQHSMVYNRVSAVICMLTVPLQTRNLSTLWCRLALLMNITNSQAENTKYNHLIKLHHKTNIHLANTHIPIHGHNLINW